MAFSTVSFLYLFFPLTFVLYFVLPGRTGRNVVLLLASLIFYAWGEPRFVLLMVAAALVAWAGGLLMHRFALRGQSRRKKLAFLLMVILLTGNLFVFKYLGFAAENLSVLLGGALPVPRLVLPIGISFYTFQILSYVIDLYRGRVAVQRNFFWLLLYVCFFPQLIAGPIVRYQTVEEEILSRSETLEDVVAGLKRFILGLAKKVLLANGTAAVAELVYTTADPSFGSAVYWIAAAAYTLQIYFDFSGYSDMAIGLGRVFGFHFLENFDYPYVACSITNFWRRWHISLSSWFRDYIYIPLGGSRGSRPRWICNILIVWSLTGIWHGASWNFLLWGLYYALLLLAEKLVLHRLLERLPKAVGWIYTMFFTMLGWVLFDLTDLSQLLEVLQKMFVWQPTDWVQTVAANSAILEGLVWLPLGILCMFPVLPRLRFRSNTLGTLFSHGLHLLLAAVCVAVILSSSYNPFIYFRF